MMRWALSIGVLLGAFLTGAGSAGAVPVTIQGTDFNDEIAISASSPFSGMYYVNDTATPFTGATSVIVNAGGGTDRVRLTNQPAGLFAPVLGVVVNGGAGVDSLSIVGGQAAYGWLDHDAAGTRTVVHGGIDIQRIVLDGVEGSIFDAVPEPRWTYRGGVGTDDVGLQETPIAPGGCCGYQVLTNGDEKVEPARKGTVTIDTKTSGATPDTVTLSGDWSLDDDLVVDDGLAEDTVRIDSYGARAQENGFPVGARVRAGVLEGDGSFYGSALAVDAGQIDVDGGTLSTKVDRLEVEADGDVSVRDADDVQVGGVWGATDGVRSGGAVSVETPGKLTVMPNEGVAGTDVTLAANGLDLLGGVRARAGAATLRPEAAGVPLDLGAAGDPSGTLGVSNAELRRIDASSIEAGGPDSGLFTVSAPVSAPRWTPLNLVSGAGFAGTAAAALAASELKLADGTSTGRSWTVSPAGVEVDGAGAIAFSSPGTLSLVAGGGDDAFAVRASPLVPYSIDGGAGNDSLTYEAEGRATSGDSTPPDGSIASPGVKPVAFGAIEAVTIAP
jgi:hypothetical protein